MGWGRVAILVIHSFIGLACLWGFLTKGKQAYYDGFALPEDQIRAVGEEIAAGMSALIRHVLEQRERKNRHHTPLWYIRFMERRSRRLGLPSYCAFPRSGGGAWPWPSGSGDEEGGAGPRRGSSHSSIHNGPDDPAMVLFVRFCVFISDSLIN